MKKLFTVSFMLIGFVGASLAHGQTGPTDFFWSTNGLGQGAVNSDANVVLDADAQTGSIFLYFSTNGSSDTNLEVGALLDVCASRPGVIRFTGAETFDFEILVGDVAIGNRWAASNNNFGAFGSIGSVSNSLVDEWGAFTTLGGPGIVEENNGAEAFTDSGYDAKADAFLFGRIDFEVIGGGTVDLIVTAGEGGIVHRPDFCNESLKATFGSATITVDNPFVLGDVNLDGSVTLLDIQPFVDLISESGFQAEADTNMDGFLNLLDVQGFVDLLSPPQPECGQSSESMAVGNCLIGDVNLDGMVSLADDLQFIQVLLNREYQCEADTNQDGRVDLLDVICLQF